MDLVKDDIKKVYWKYFLAAFGSSFLSSVYSLVDLAVSGQYEGPDGSSAISVAMPLLNIVYSLGILIGVGGSIIFSKCLGEGDKERAKVSFTNDFIILLLVTGIIWLVLFLAEEPLLIFFGGSGHILELSKRYLEPIMWGIPVLTLGQFIGSYLRSDGAPVLATIAIIAGGAFNVFGDIFFVNTCDMGIKGAGLATVVGQIVGLLIMSTHFFSRKSLLRFRKPQHFFRDFLLTVEAGFSSALTDMAMGVMIVLYNNQIMRYLDSDALSVYGVAMEIMMFVQCCSYAIGQAASPILSENYGSQQMKRIHDLVKMALVLCFFFAVIWTALVLAVPNVFIRLFMKPSERVLAIAPKILRIYGLSFIFLPFNVFGTYCFSSIGKGGVAILLSFLRGIAVPLLLLFSLPAMFGGDAVWWSEIGCEGLTFMVFAVLLALNLKKISKDDKKAREEGKLK